MAYSNNPNLPSARAIATQLLVRDQLPLHVVANKCGVHRSTIYRWKQKWLELNKHVQLTNDNRPGRRAGARFRQAALRWRIATLCPTPHTFPNAICTKTVNRILELRNALKRCAEVVWHHITQIDRIAISLSSVRRILRRHHCFDGARKNVLAID